MYKSKDGVGGGGAGLKIHGGRQPANGGPVVWLPTGFVVVHSRFRVLGRLSLAADASPEPGLLWRTGFPDDGTLGYRGGNGRSTG